MTDEVKVNAMFKQLGIGLIDNGVQFLRRSFKTNTESKSFGFIRDRLNYVGLVAVVETDMDLRYKLADWSAWQEILAMVNTILKKIPYVTDFFDCDNYAFFTSSFVPLVFGINCGECFGKFINNSTGQEFMHHWNLIMDRTGNVYMYDGMSGNSCQVFKDQKIKMGMGTYYPQTVKFF
jgi:hypothetical protein